MAEGRKPSKERAGRSPALSRSRRSGSLPKIWPMPPQPSWPNTVRRAHPAGWYEEPLPCPVGPGESPESFVSSAGAPAPPGPTGPPRHRPCVHFSAYCQPVPRDSEPGVCRVFHESPLCVLTSVVAGGLAVHLTWHGIDSWGSVIFLDVVPW